MAKKCHTIYIEQMHFNGMNLLKAILICFILLHQNLLDIILTCAIQSCTGTKTLVTMLIIFSLYGRLSLRYIRR